MSFQPRSLEELATEFPPDLKHVSASSLKMIVRCEEQWRQRYILGRKEAPALAMLTGRADHAAIERSMEQKITSGVDLPVPEVRDTYVAELEKAVDQEGGLGEITVRDAESPQAKLRAYDEQRRHGQEVVAVYHRIVSPTIQPTAVEKEFNHPVPGLPVVMNGRIDLIGEGGRIIDRKRRARSTVKPEADWALQAEIYQLVEPLPFEWQISVTTKEPKVLYGDPGLLQAVPRKARTERLVNQLVAKIGFLYMKYGPDEPWPATGKLHPWACGFCGFREDCWGWQ